MHLGRMIENAVIVEAEVGGDSVMAGRSSPSSSTATTKPTLSATSWVRSRNRPTTSPSCRPVHRWVLPCSVPPSATRSSTRHRPVPSPSRSSRRDPAEACGPRHGLLVPARERHWSHTSPATVLAMRLRLIYNPCRSSGVVVFRRRFARRVRRGRARDRHRD